MRQNYEVPFTDLRLQISQYSPGSIPLLEQMKSEFGAQIAYYAAFVLVCVRARQENTTTQSIYTPKANDLKEFTFFTVTKDYPAALALFDDLLVGFNHEQTTQTHIPLPPLGANRLTPSASDNADTGSES